MSELAIRVQGVSKQYQIGRTQDGYRTLRDTFMDAFASPFRRARNLLRGQAAGAAELSETIWALRDVSLEIKRGEVVGIIGRNGAGKSTLLKILTRITEPTEGWAEIRGRVGSLLEVGTGFHAELTGRENTYLNGAILGMSRAEIDRKFDEIVAFAEISKFIDTPVKHYSSGMYTRLAFAVAAHLEPEVLIVDEVLAVGDVRFQKKCLDKMQAVGEEGRTVLFVSHNMATVTRLCPRTILLVEGRVLGDGPSHRVVSTYLNSERGTTAAREWPDPEEAPGGEVARLRAVRVRTEKGQITDTVDIRRPVGLEMEYEVLRPGYLLGTYFAVFNEEGVHLFFTDTHEPEWLESPRPTGRYTSIVWIPGNFFAEGTMLVTAGADTGYPSVRRQFREPDVVAFQVVDPMEGGSARGEWTGPIPGVVRPLLKWSTQFSPDGLRAAEIIGQEAEK